MTTACSESSTPLAADEPGDRLPDIDPSVTYEGDGLGRSITRYDKTAVRYEATVLVAAINEWL
ncbi:MULTISPECIES: hypothetical protein [unclassified Streptomyces]|uniref:hypothetical protein n=1 Tax=unclassified Streptomyces TaxID=2593676 RepID=UPI0037AA87AF